jgi:hypothetical protein
LLPSADEATATQLLLLGALVCVQVWAVAGLTAANKPQKNINSNPVRRITKEV